MDADHLLQPWLDCLLETLPAAPIFDSHTHIGEHDPSGFSATLEQLLEALEAVDGRAAVFPLAEPEGYGAANITCTKAAAEHPDRLIAFARVTPQDRPTEVFEQA